MRYHRAYLQAIRVTTHAQKVALPQPCLGAGISLKHSDPWGRLNCLFTTQLQETEAEGKSSQASSCYCNLLACRKHSSVRQQSKQVSRMQKSDGGSCLSRRRMYLQSHFGRLLGESPQGESAGTKLKEGTFWRPLFNSPSLVTTSEKGTTCQ